MDWKSLEIQCHFVKPPTSSNQISQDAESQDARALMEKTWTPHLLDLSTHPEARVTTDRLGSRVGLESESNQSDILSTYFVEGYRGRKEGLNKFKNWQRSRWNLNFELIGLPKTRLTEFQCTLTLSPVTPIESSNKIDNCWIPLRSVPLQWKAGLQMSTVSISPRFAGH